ncbi:beta-ketoacyl-[acyl-carrier-protein] synthase family protein [Streptomyces radicis]|uniref:Beta-ketoacyl-[acyl-carrier-protein] synthase family protein n=1 Tax=Streptomyces radicis TaxID=1750517 RepID=A0A3A9VVU6_9ACTN|nr:beta-ketoacyl-[acyl-carrier-protein] synthase family protein [Streptomyces radicis]RKN25390.1 beta-ketoacyl-[acyl-carrier-protein] synthase family protein [Streptomyces radicis]
MTTPRTAVGATEGALVPPSAHPVAVTGIGMLTPAGNTPEETWTGLCRGRSLARRDPVLAGLPVDISCRVEGFDAVAAHGRVTARRLDRFAHLALAAARGAVADAKLDPATWSGERVAVILGVGSNSLETYAEEFARLAAGRPAAVSPMALPRSVPNMVAGTVAIDLNARGPGFTVASACASGATAIGVARDLLLAGACDIAVAGGSESGRARMTATCFARMGALSRRTAEPEAAARPFDVERDGFVLAEGAAALVLERQDHALRRGAQARALLRGYAATSDAHHPVAPDPEGAGAERALRAALSDAGCAPRDIGQITAHGTSTPAGDAAEALALLRAFDGAPPPVTAPKGALGHCLGAAGAIGAALTVLALERQEIPPTANLRAQDPALALDVVTGHRPRPAPVEAAVSNAFGFGGQNAVLVLTRG